MHAIVTRLRGATALLLAVSLLGVGPMALPAVGAPNGEDHISIGHFMTGLACIESSGRYTAVNARSGAYGKYQIMPRNWPVWARRFLGDRWAEPSPQNQEFVARERIAQLHRSRDSWRRVAYWWLTGRSGADATRWSKKALGYVNAVMRIVERAASPRSAGRVPERCLPGAFDEPEVRTQSRERVGVAAGAVYVRRAPGYENRLFAVVRRGMVVPIFEKANDPRGRPWLRVGLRDGRTGWIAAWFTRPVSSGG